MDNYWLTPVNSCEAVTGSGKTKSIVDLLRAMKRLAPTPTIAVIEEPVVQPARQEAEVMNIHEDCKQEYEASTGSGRTTAIASSIKVTGEE